MYPIYLFSWKVFDPRQMGSMVRLGSESWQSRLGLEVGVGAEQYRACFNARY